VRPQKLRAQYTQRVLPPSDIDVLRVLARQRTITIAALLARAGCVSIMSAK
jgi:hypothetical protein